MFIVLINRLFSINVKTCVHDDFIGISFIRVNYTGVLTGGRGCPKIPVFLIRKSLPYKRIGRDFYTHFIVIFVIH